MDLKKIDDRKGMAVYLDESKGGQFAVRVVDREYAKTVKKPEYFFERLEGDKGVYISGMFPTKKQGVYSMDIKNKVTGVRQMFDAIFEDGGQMLRVQPKAPKAPASK